MPFIWPPISNETNWHKTTIRTTIQQSPNDENEQIKIRHLLTKTAIQFHIYLAEHTSPALTVITWGVKFAPTEYAILSPTIQNLAKKNQ